ncbi:hypothetical protein [Listeria monocytogenes]|uniref:hypothetical protein n=1 Tax=Listeria monocytogenes TaxID=1639 RepID=UPI00083D0EB2|nr:hypothetical protein [Listeria monocytogenes]EAE8567857.1 hypothetical protein [Listeria monocytogenes]EAF6962954.1 hypothetical protein [Listeria monocytogenes]EAF8119751.1 hypothetical protein [Listeria monocytogenes]EDO0419944.1 hypothetical protein [Listeria monocytogenes]EHF6226488.1 hypothetical protein [Listeria monocytogenes]
MELNRVTSIILKTILTIGLLFTAGVFSLNFLGKYPVLGTISLISLAILCLAQVIFLLIGNVRVSAIICVLLIVFSVILLVSVGADMWWTYVLLAVVCSLISVVIAKN